MGKERAGARKGGRAEIPAGPARKLFSPPRLEIKPGTPGTNCLGRMTEGRPEKPRPAGQWRASSGASGGVKPGTVAPENR